MSAPPRGGGYRGYARREPRAALLRPTTVSLDAVTTHHHTISPRPPAPTKGGARTSRAAEAVAAAVRRVGALRAHAAAHARRELAPVFPGRELEGVRGPDVSAHGCRPRQVWRGGRGAEGRLLAQVHAVGLARVRRCGRGSSGRTMSIRARACLCTTGRPPLCTRRLMPWSICCGTRPTPRRDAASCSTQSGGRRYPATLFTDAPIETLLEVLGVVKERAEVSEPRAAGRHCHRVQFAAERHAGSTGQAFARQVGARCGGFRCCAPASLSWTSAWLKAFRAISPRTRAL